VPDGPAPDELPVDVDDDFETEIDNDNQCFRSAKI
jgi:hypothetical protein